MADPATPSSPPALLAFTSQIVAAYAVRNKVAADALPDLIRSVHRALGHVDVAASEIGLRKPAVPINQSIHPDYLVCLEDGAHVRVLTRYLKRFNLTPATYRAKWGLPRDYPMVSSASTVRRSAAAKPTVAMAEERPAMELTPDIVLEPAASSPVEPEPQHTAASVFANFPGGDVVEEAPPVANDTGKPGRKRFAQQFMRDGRRRA